MTVDRGQATTACFMCFWKRRGKEPLRQALLNNLRDSTRALPHVVASCSQAACKERVGCRARAQGAQGLKKLYAPGGISGPSGSDKNSPATTCGAAAFRTGATESGRQSKAHGPSLRDTGTFEDFEDGDRNWTVTAHFERLTRPGLEKGGPKRTVLLQSTEPSPCMERGARDWRSGPGVAAAKPCYRVFDKGFVVHGKFKALFHIAT